MYLNVHSSTIYNSQDICVNVYTHTHTHTHIHTHHNGILLLLLLSHFSWSNSVQPHRRHPTRLPHPWDSPGKNTRVDCHFLLQCMKVKSESESLSRVQLLATPWTAAHQGPPSMGFSRQEYWIGVE